MIPCIKHINHGIASRVKDTIYVNKNLVKYKMLYERIISHEMSHTDKKFTLKDLAKDLGIDELRDIKREYWKFIITHPSSWTEFLPVVIMENKIILSPEMIVFYLFTILFFVFIFKII